MRSHPPLASAVSTRQISAQAALCPGPSPSGDRLWRLTHKVAGIALRAGKCFLQHSTLALPPPLPIGGNGFFVLTMNAPESDR
jgi:hypothetical protein